VAAAPVKNSTAVEDVVITAQKRKERLQSVAVSAQTLKTSTLAQSNVSDISDISKLVPSVSIQGTTNGRVPYAMRGVTTTANEGNVGLSSGVAILLDGVPIPSDSHAADQIQDVDNIQVLKGPQATLGGRTAAAGVVDIITRSPRDQWTGTVTSTFTTDQEKRGDFFISGPINDALQFSLAGYGNDTPYPIKNVYDGKFTTVTNEGFRGKLAYHPTQDLTVTLTGYYGHDQSYGDNFVYTYISPGSTLLFPGSPFTIPAELGSVTPHYGNGEANSVAQNEGAIITDRTANLTIDYQLGKLDITSTTAVQREQGKFTQDLFVLDNFFFTELTGGAIPYDNNQTIRNDVKQVSEELRVASPATDRFNYVGGFFYSDTTVDSISLRTLPPAGESLNVHPDTATYDLYGRATYKITPQFSLTAGLRFNYDDLSYSYDQLVFVPFAPNQSAGHHAAGAAVGDVSAQYFFTANNMAYATYSRGYAPPAYNTAAPLLNPLPEKPVSREDINDFEVGSKGTYFDRRLLANITAFYTLYDNYQIQTYDSFPGLINPPLILANAPKAATRGVELDGTWRATDALTLSLNAAYTDAYFVKWQNAPCAQIYLTGTCNGQPGGPTHQNVDGRTLPNSPNLKFTVNTSYDVSLPGGWSVLLDSNYAYRTSAQMLPDQDPHGVQGAYGILNLNATAESPNGKYSVMVFVNNLTNKFYYTDIEDFWNTVWANPAGEAATQGQPARDARRYAGVRLTAKF
jgi:iron complex outermembrane receptor protein